jgi:hypothetical protein
MDTNVSDMPLDIFCDYISDTLGEEWSWEYFGLVINGPTYHSFRKANGVGNLRHGHGLGNGAYNSVGNSDGVSVFLVDFSNIHCGMPLR